MLSSLGVRYDTSKPDGTPQKLLDVSRMTGVEAKVSLGEGVYGWYVSEYRGLLTI